MVWVIAFGELFFGDLWCVVWGYGGMRTHFSLLNPQRGCRKVCTDFVQRLWSTLSSVLMLKHENALLCSLGISTFYADV